MTTTAGPAPRVDGVLLDLYGTAVDVEIDEDSPRLWNGLASALGASGVTVDPQDLRGRFQQLLRDEARHGREGFLMEPVFRRLLASLRAGDDVAWMGRLFRQLSLTQVHLRPYVTPLLDRLHHSGVKVGIVSNTEAVLTRFELDCFPVLERADAVLLSSDIGVRKPDPRIFDLALDRLGTSRNATVCIGNDWTADVLGARGAGLRAIYVHGPTIADNPAVEHLPGVIETAPTLEAITGALRALGWHEPARARPTVVRP